MADTKTLLVIEDDELLLDQMRAVLEKHGFKVEVARDGKSGLERVLSLKPDLTLLDIMLPELNGVEFLRQLKEDAWGKTAPIMVLTNLDSKGHLAQVLELGNYDYLAKTDWSLEDLVVKVKERLGLK
jgi:DNA-binding response OmpR family regulator